MHIAGVGLLVIITIAIGGHAVLALHEAGHVIAHRLLGHRIDHVVLGRGTRCAVAGRLSIRCFPLGGQTIYRSDQIMPWAELATGLAGSAMVIIVGLILALITRGPIGQTIWRVSLILGMWDQWIAPGFDGSTTTRAVTRLIPTTLQNVRLIWATIIIGSVAVSIIQIFKLWS